MGADNRKVVTFDFKGKEQPTELTFSLESQRKQCQWKESVNNAIYSATESETEKSVCGKLEIYLMRFCLIIRTMKNICNEESAAIIDAGSAEAAIELVEYFREMDYHHDTDNNHVHILSTRIQPNGSPIPDHHDYARLNAAANRILSSYINRDIQRMFSYGYLTEGQFANIIRSHGYKFERVEDSYVVFRGGVKAATISFSEIERHISQENDVRKEWAKQLRAIIRKYKDGIQLFDGSKRTRKMSPRQ